MIPYVTVEQMREIDRLAVEYGISILQMMEIAGRSIALHAREMVGPSKIVCLVGKGNNGGDALVAGRHLSSWGANVSFICASDTGNEYVIHQRATIEALGLPLLADGWQDALDQADLIIDGLLGVVRGDPHGTVAELIEMTAGRILAVDCPSGLDADTGHEGSPCIQATHTVTLTLPKQGLRHAPAAGKVFVADLGLPPQIFKRVGVPIPRFTSDIVPL